MVSYVDFQLKATADKFQGIYGKAKLYRDETVALEALGPGLTLVLTFIFSRRAFRFPCCFSLAWFIHLDASMLRLLGQA